MTKVVGFMGERGAGKDTAAKALIALGWVPRAFGAGIYDQCSEAFGVPRELFGRRETKETPLPELALINCSNAEFIKVALTRPDETVTAGMDPLLAPRSPRFIMQTWGTEYRRAHYGNDYWVNPVAAEVQAAPNADYAFTDVRDDLEIALVRHYGGPLIRILNPGLPTTDTTTMSHSSEQNVRNHPVDLEIVNHPGVENIPVMQAKVVEFIRNWYSVRLAA
ncbi:hypothetical protein ACOTHJ_13625 [Achromobacter xylosoxidans]